ncbi:hypothetical protein [Alienimonas californiensis]|uniref:Uncharacterized protein n=1 Tax=Alienimonas californiensis TaxID=2527989 RepID=A0A517P9F2_9PLAN|nr:hypothetical protein [Alienimonas californiensis]QDT15998.1 hypothetical protein CA12_20960 [Alienimonas californiensis]
MTPALLAAALLAGSPTAATPAVQLGGLFDGLFGDAEPVDAPERPESGSGLTVESASGPAFSESGSGLGARFDGRPGAAAPVQSGSGVRFESGSGLRRGFDPLPDGAYDNPPRFRGESGSGTQNGGVSPPPIFWDGDSWIRATIPPDGSSESGSGVESGSDPYGGRPNPFGRPSERFSGAPGVIAPPPRPRTAEPRSRAEFGGGFDPNELPPPSDTPPPPGGDARVHALLVSLGWIAALVAGGIAGYLLGLSRGAERRRRSLEPRQLDLAGEVAETADSLLAAANAGEAGRYEACVDRLRERVGRTAVLLDDRSAGAVRELVAAATTGSPTEPQVDRDVRLQTAYDGLVHALRRSVRGG